MGVCGKGCWGKQKPCCRLCRSAFSHADFFSFFCARARSWARARSLRRTNTWLCTFFIDGKSTTSNWPSTGVPEFHTTFTERECVCVSEGVSEGVSEWYTHTHTQTHTNTHTHTQNTHRVSAAPSERSSTTTRGRGKEDGTWRVCEAFVMLIRRCVLVAKDQVALLVWLCSCTCFQHKRCSSW